MTRANLPSSVFVVGKKAQSTLWSPGGTITETFPRMLVSAAIGITPVSGQPYFTGGAVLPAGSTANGIGMVASGASVTPTHCVFFLALPDDDPAVAAAAVLATSQDDTSGTAWAANAPKELSLLTGSGGSGPVTVEVDTPVYVGFWQVAGTPAKPFGLSPTGQIGNITGNPKAYGSSSGGLTDPTSIGGVISVSSTTVAPYAYILGTLGSGNA